MEEALAAAKGVGQEEYHPPHGQACQSRSPFGPVSARTSIVLIVISLAAVAGVAYSSYRAGNETHSLDRRVSVLEQANRDSTSRFAQLRADRGRLCTSVDHVREKITGVILTPGSPAPDFDIGADPLSAPDRIILALYNWCQETP